MEWVDNVCQESKNNILEVIRMALEKEISY